MKYLPFYRMGSRPSFSRCWRCASFCYSSKFSPLILCKVPHGMSSFNHKNKLDAKSLSSTVASRHRCTPHLTPLLRNNLTRTPQLAAVVLSCAGDSQADHKGNIVHYHVCHSAGAAREAAACDATDGTELFSLLTPATCSTVTVSPSLPSQPPPPSSSSTCATLTQQISLTDTPAQVPCQPRSSR